MLATSVNVLIDILINLSIILFLILLIVLIIGKFIHDYKQDKKSKKDETAEIVQKYIIEEQPRNPTIEYTKENAVVPKINFHSIDYKKRQKEMGIEFK